MISTRKNIFNLITHNFDYLEKVTYEVYSRIIYGKSRRSRRRDALGRLKEMHEKLKKHQELIRLKPLILEIVQLIKDNFEFIVNSIERDERVHKRAEHARFLGQVMGKIMTKLSYEYRTYEKFNQDNSPKKIMDDNANTNERDFKKVLAKKILQLDDLYCSANDLKSKALILSQMIQLVKEIDPSVMEEEVTDRYGYKKGKLYDVALDIIGQVCATIDQGQIIYRHEYCSFLSWLDYTRARIFSYLAEKKLVTIDDLEKKKE